MEHSISLVNFFHQLFCLRLLQAPCLLKKRNRRIKRKSLMKNNKKLIKLLIKLREIKPKKKTILSMLTKQLMNTMIEVYCKIILFTNIKKITF
jgi:hypothetical protein